MSPENIGIVRRAYEVLNGGGTIDDLMARLRPLLDRRIEWVNPANALERGSRAGLEGWRVALENLRAGFGEEVTLEVHELVEHGDAVFATGRPRVSGTSTSVRGVGPTWAAIWTVTDSHISRYEWSWDPLAMRTRFKSVNRLSD
jgi:ketosteroid isomerase-like protein